jgi:hypothetical protein
MLITLGQSLGVSTEMVGADQSGEGLGIGLMLLWMCVCENKNIWKRQNTKPRFEAGPWLPLNPT